MSKNTSLSSLINYVSANSSGNVTIAAPSSGYALDVSGTGRFTGQLTLGSTITNGTYTYTLPGATGTLALTSALSAYLPLAGGTLTGALSGTSATFSGLTVDNNQNASTWIISKNQNAGSGAAAGFLMTNNTGDLGAISLLSSGNSPANGLFIRTLSTNSLILGTNSTANLTIASGGAATFSSSVTAAAFTPSYSTSYFGTDGTISNYSAANYMYVNGTGGLRLKAEGVGYQKIVLEGGTSNDVWFTTANTERLRITSGGNVGIGTTSPSYLLDIQSTSATLRIKNTTAPATGGTSSLLFEGINNYSGTSQSFINSIQAGNSGATQLVFGTSGTTDATATERMRITSSGNVGIGTSSPKTILSINGGSGAYPTLGTNVTNSFLVGRNDGLLGTYFGYAADGNGWIQQMRNDSATAYNLILQPVGGNVGIGTTSPTTYSLAGRHLELNDAGGGYAFYHNMTTSVKSFWATNESAGLSALFTFSNHPLTLGTNNTERMRITSGGRVGIGITSPGAALQVAQPGVDDQLILGSTANNRDHAMFMCSGPNQAEIIRYQSGVRLILAASTSISNVDVIPGGTNGVRLSAGNTSWSAYTSDARRKKNFESVPGLDAIMQVEPVKYHFNTQDNSEVKKLGFTAQNILPLIPEMVHPNGEKEDDGSDTLTIIPDYILPVLVQAIKDQQAQIEELKQLINK